MRKKIISVICVCLLLLNVQLCTFATDGEAQVKLPRDYAVAHTLITKLTGEDLFDTSKEQVTRIEFLSALENIMKTQKHDDQSFTFSDIPHNTEEGMVVYTALSEGWISRAEFFNPQISISFNEACKMIVSAMDYTIVAQSFGGYPSGYVSVVQRLGISKGLISTSAINYADATVMLFNLLNCDYAERGYYTNAANGSVEFVKTGYTYLNKLYDVFETEGICNRTTYNSLSYNTSVEEKGVMEINGILYKYDEVSPELLSNYCRVYYLKNAGDREIICAHIESENFRMELDSYRGHNGEKILYEDEDGKQRSVRIESSPYMIFNNRFVNGFDYTKFENDGYALFIDNDKDGIYESVQINAYTYVEVSGIDRYNGIIGDKNNSAYSIDTSKAKEKNALIIRDVNGVEISIYSIEHGSILQVKKADDLYWVEIDIIKTSISGTVSSKGEDGEYFIDEKEYKASKYFSANYGKKDLLGQKGSFIIGYNNSLVSYGKGVEGYKYGYLLKSGKQGAISGKVQIKLFTQEGKQAIFDAAKRVRIDGVLKKTTDEIYDAVKGRSEAVKYCVDDEGRISKLDFAAVYDENSGEMQTSDPDNSFVYYDTFTGEELLYRSPNTMFNSYFNAANALCMKIPTNDDAQDRYFQVGTAANIFSNNSKYTNLYAYDIDEYGYAAFICQLYNTSGGISAGGKGSVYVITDVYRGINADGEDSIGITCWHEGSYSDFYIASELSIVRDIEASLCVGDVVRLKADINNIVYALSVDFNVSSFKKDNSLSATNYENKNASYSCWFGVPYSSDGKYVQLMTKKDIDGNYITAKSQLKNFSLNTANIVRVDLETKEVRPIEKSEIKTYRAFGTEAEYMWIVQDCDAPAVIVLFDNYS